MQKWLKTTQIFAHKMANFFFKKRRITFVEHPTGIFGPNFSSKASVTFSNCAGKCQKMKCSKAAKMLKIALFLRKTAYFEIFSSIMINILVCN